MKENKIQDQLANIKKVSKIQQLSLIRMLCTLTTGDSVWQSTHQNQQVNRQIRKSIVIKIQNTINHQWEPETYEPPSLTAISSSPSSSTYHQGLNNDTA